MRWRLPICVTIIIISSCLPIAASAQRDPGFEAGLSIVSSGDERVPIQEASGFGRNKVVKRDTRTPKIVGASLAIAGGVSLVGAWATYVARQNYRLRSRRSLPADDIASWESQGAWAFWLGMGGAAALVGSEYVLLPEAKDVPTLAWIGGLAGLVTGAVGAGFFIGGTQCAPLAVRPGAVIPKACLSGTADDVFGLLLIQTSLPLLNLPLTYLLRSAFATEPEPLTFEVGPGSLTVRGTF
jgi:hypothetical protein